MRRVIISGGGFVGIYAALRSQTRVGRCRDLEVTLVNRKIFSADVHAAAGRGVERRYASHRRADPAHLPLHLNSTLDLFFARDTVRLAQEEAGRDPRVSVGDDSASRRLE